MIRARFGRSSLPGRRAIAESSQAGTMRSGRTLNHLVPGRDCGDCVACCEVLHIVDPEVGKPAGIMCRHNTGNGCGIHATRPEICRCWFCLWRRIDAMPDEARPDRCGVIFCLEGEGDHPNPFARFCVVARPVGSSRALRSELVRQVIAMFARQGELPVWVHRHGVRSLIHPPPELADAIERPEKRRSRPSCLLRWTGAGAIVLLGRRIEWAPRRLLSANAFWR